MFIITYINMAYFGKFIKSNKFIHKFSIEFFSRDITNRLPLTVLISQKYNK